ncbi:unnamed protein product [Mytilus coruscus]|uniref:Uncharacterized protein n=1 Tax=Mytilus coruscus TaxID=42192 RepID=A0A6J8CS63_MYTCO|nr:unnamed protein product [Mytilus coruscus]
MMERRNIIWSIFKREKRLGNQARLKEDKLHTNGHRIYSEDVIEAQKNAPNLSNNHSSQDNMDPAQQGSQFLREHFDPPAGPRAAMLPNELLDKHNSSNVPSKYFRWIGDKKNQFVDGVERKLTIDNLPNQLDTLYITNEHFQTDSNELVESLNKVFIDSASENFGSKPIKSSRVAKHHQP